MLSLLEEKLKHERETSELSYIEEDFFFKLQEHLSILSQSKDPVSQKELSLIMGAVEELVGVRAEKILQGRKKGVLREEHSLMELAETLQRFKRDVLTSLLQRETQTQKVEVLQDLPQFYGPALEVLGPYRKGETVLLDRSVATRLKEKGLVEER